MTDSFLSSRRRMIARDGMPMTLRRQTGVDPVVLLPLAIRGVFSTYRPEQIIGGIKQGDAAVAILQDEIRAAAWPGPPRSGDSILIDRVWQVVGALSVRHGELILGHYLWIRGGGT